MEDVLDQYEQPLDPAEPVICLDEQPYQLLDDVRPSTSAAPGTIAKRDYEYRRCGTCSVFVAVEPKAGKRFVKARRRRTRVDFARFVRDVVKRYPPARRIHVVLDNLNTHNSQSLIEAFGAEAAQPLLKRLAWHHTPKHASWLNIAECELSVLSRQCLDRRIESKALLENEVRAWEQERNQQKVRVDWQFTTADARIKLKRLYPELALVTRTQSDH